MARKRARKKQEKRRGDLVGRLQELERRGADEEFLALAARELADPAEGPSAALWVEVADRALLRALEAGDLARLARLLPSLGPAGRRRPLAALAAAVLDLAVGRLDAGRARLETLGAGPALEPGRGRELVPRLLALAAGTTGSRRAALPESGELLPAAGAGRPDGRRRGHRAPLGGPAPPARSPSAGGPGRSPGASPARGGRVPAWGRRGPGTGPGLAPAPGGGTFRRRRPRSPPRDRRAAPGSDRRSRRDRGRAGPGAPPGAGEPGRPRGAPPVRRRPGEGPGGARAAASRPARPRAAPRLARGPRDGGGAGRRRRPRHPRRGPPGADRTGGRPAHRCRRQGPPGSAPEPGAPRRRPLRGAGRLPPGARPDRGPTLRSRGALEPRALGARPRRAVGGALRRPVRRRAGRVAPAPRRGAARGDGRPDRPPLPRRAAGRSRPRPA